MSADLAAVLALWGLSALVYAAARILHRRGHLDRRDEARSLALVILIGVLVLVTFITECAPPTTQLPTL